MTSPLITTVQLENRWFPLRFSACTYQRQGNFHEEHSKGAWLASHVFLALPPTHITPEKKKTCCSVRVASLCHWCCLFQESLCFVVFLRIVYTLALFHRFILIQNYLFAMYILIYNRAGPFHLLLPSV